MIKLSKVAISVFMTSLLLGCSPLTINPITKGQEQSQNPLQQSVQSPQSVPQSNQTVDEYAFGTRNNPNGTASFIGGFFVNTTLPLPNEPLHVSKEFSADNVWPGIFLEKSKHWIFNSGFFIFVISADSQRGEATVVYSFENGYDYQGAKSMVLNLSLSCRNNTYTIHDVTAFDNYFTFGNKISESNSGQEKRTAKPNAPDYFMIRLICDQMEIQKVMDEY